MARGFELLVLDEIARGSHGTNPSFKSRAGAEDFAKGYSSTGKGHEVHVVQRSKGIVISTFRDGKKIL